MGTSSRSFPVNWPERWGKTPPNVGRLRDTSSPNACLTSPPFVHILSTFCSFFKFSFQINPNALKRIEYQNNPYIYPGYSFQASKMLQYGELEK